MTLDDGPDGFQLWLRTPAGQRWLMWWRSLPLHERWLRLR